MMHTCKNGEENMESELELKESWWSSNKSERSGNRLSE